MPRKTAPQLPPTLTTEAELVTIEEASDRLGKGYSRRSIFRRIQSGDWQEGIHWIDDRQVGSSNRLIKINLTAVQLWRSTPAAFR
jgi:hypothetical protein